MNDLEMQKIESTQLMEVSESKISSPSAETKNISDDAQNTEIGWGSMIFRFLKVLLFGACVFFYDMTSKFLLELYIGYHFIKEIIFNVQDFHQAITIE